MNNEKSYNYEIPPLPIDIGIVRNDKKMFFFNTYLVIILPKNTDFQTSDN